LADATHRADRQIGSTSPDAMALAQRLGAATKRKRLPLLRPGGFSTLRAPPFLSPGPLKGRGLPISGC